MDKRFFLALFLSLIVIAVSQLLFPSAKPTPSKGALAKDSVSGLSTASSTPATAKPTPVTQAVVSAQTPTATSVGTAAETTTVTTARAIYKFTSVGAAPVVAVIRDYKNRSVSSGLVDLGTPGLPLLGYRLITATDTVDLSRVPFKLTRARTTTGDDVLT